jgi:outer membrane protein assembly factor BamB
LSGKLLWSFNAGGRIDASPVIVRDKVLTATMDGMLYMVGLESGSETWSFEVGSAITHNPAVISGYIVLGARDGNIYCFGN